MIGRVQQFIGQHPKRAYRIGVLGFALFLFALTAFWHKGKGYFNHRSELWADKSGYYIYLPALFKYDFDAHAFPEDLETQLGDGFKLDSLSGKVNTKYTCGVALLQVPFYLVADFLAPEGEDDGFSPVYHKSVNWAANIYLLIGLLFLERFLRRYFARKTIYWVLMTIFFGTNLLYYSIDETGMSHVYSFAMGSIYLYLLHATSFFKRRHVIQTFVLGLVMGMIILLRPTNIILLGIGYLLDIQNGKQLKERLLLLFRPAVLMPLLIGVLLPLIPQMLYWNYLYDSPIRYSYGDEGFNWTSPQLIKTWWSTYNGLFPYSPFYLIILSGVAYMIIKRRTNGWLLAITFLLTSYIFSSWWIWTFGCSFGGRNFIDYLPLYSIAIAHLYTAFPQWPKRHRIVWGIIIFAFIAANVKLTYTYDECYYGQTEWNWDYFFNRTLFW